MADSWVPEACLLPTAERPLRVAEFDELFAEALIGRERVTATSLRLRLAGGADVAERVRDLVARESDCCSFFQFGVRRDEDDVVVLDVEVPAAQVAVLDAMAAGAEAQHT